MSDIFLVLSGLLLGLSFLGGLYLWFIPLGLMALFFGWLNRPKKHIPVFAKPITDRIDKLVRVEPKGTQFVTQAELDGENESRVVVQHNKLWQEIESDVEQHIYDTLTLFKKLLPQIYTAAVFFPSRNPDYFELKTFCSESDGVLERATLSSNHGLVGQLIKKDVPRILEGDISGGKTLYYYKNDPPVHSIAAVPIIQNQQTRGAVVVDSLQSNAFDGETISYLKIIAKIVGNTAYMSYMKVKNHIEKDQFDVLYRYQQNFFQSMSVNDIYVHIADYIRTTIPYDRLLILVLDNPKEGKGRVVHASGIDEEFFKNQNFSFNDEGLLVVSMSRNTAAERNIAPGDSLIRIKQSEKQNHDIRHIMVLPVLTDVDNNRAEMVISLERRVPERYTKHEMGLLKPIAGAAGFAFMRTRAFEEQQEQASRDGLTGLINHRTFHEKLRLEKLRANRQGINIGILMTDIDKFKSINDTYGHPAGDIVIRNIAAILKKEVRQDLDVVARYGGEEFIVMLVDATEQSLRDTAERIRVSVEQKSFDIERIEPIHLTISIGVFLMTPEFSDIRKALEYADQALYKAKNSGRNRVVEYI